MKGTKAFRYINNFTAGYIFIMTFPVFYIITFAQLADRNLEGWMLYIVIPAFWGSILCLATRFCIAFIYLKYQSFQTKKILGYIFFTFGSGLSLFLLIRALYINKWSITAHENLDCYSIYQLFMCITVIAQWFGTRIFIR